MIAVTRENAESVLENGARQALYALRDAGQSQFWQRGLFIQDDAELFADATKYTKTFAPQLCAVVVGDLSKQDCQRYYKSVTKPLMFTMNSMISPSTWINVETCVANLVVGHYFKNPAQPEFYVPSKLLPYAYAVDISHFAENVSLQCKEFCKQMDIEEVLRKCINQLKFTFSNVSSMSFDFDRFIEDDVCDNGHILMKLVVKSDQNTFFMERKKWVNWITNHISDDVRDYFVLSVKRI